MADVFGPIIGIAAYLGGAVAGWRLVRRRRERPPATSGFWKGATMELRVSGFAFLALLAFIPFAFLAQYSAVWLLQAVVAWLGALGIGVGHGALAHGLAGRTTRNKQ